MDRNNLCGSYYENYFLKVICFNGTVYSKFLGGAVFCCFFGKKMINVGRMRNLAPSCTLTTREQDLKGSYDNCLYIEKNYGLVGSGRTGLGLVSSGAKSSPGSEKDEFSNLRVPQFISSTQL